jgi:ribulose kinase
LAELDASAATIPVGAGGVVVLDGFQGNRTPHVDGRCRGMPAHICCLVSCTAAMAERTHMHTHAHARARMSAAHVHGPHVILRQYILLGQCTGAIWGLSLGTTRAHLYRAMLEGVAFGTRAMLDAVATSTSQAQQKGCEPSRLVVVGG